MEQLRNFLKLFHVQGLGRSKLLLLINHFENNLEAILQSNISELKSTGLDSEIASRILQTDDENIEQYLRWLEKPDNHIVKYDDAAYPALLKEIPDFPLALFCSGNIELLESPQIAMVGSRNCTPGGAQTAYKFAAAMAQAGITITSGMALGIDTQAHLGALSVRGSTIAVTGTGVDQIYPSKNKQLAYDIHETGLLVSEFPLGTTPNSYNFPRRNRIISGLSIGTLVVEATIRSGSLITAQQALEQGREVFAIPGAINNPQAMGCHQLIRQGAKLTDQVTDIIDELSSLLGYLGHQVSTPAESNYNLLDPEQNKLLECIGYEPVNTDDLVKRSGLTIEHLSSMLLLLELNNHIQSLPGGCVARI